MSSMARCTERLFICCTSVGILATRLAMAERVAKIPTDVQQMNKRSVHRAMELMGLRAAIRAGAEIQALALTTASSRETFARFRDGVSKALDARDAAFGDYRTKG